MAKGARRPGRFVRGGAPGGPSERRLATVLFTDIVGSTELGSRLGDRRWRALRDLHDRIIRRELKRFDGREMDTAGDGFFAIFSGLDQAIACAGAIMDELAEIGIPIRAGLHMGEVEPAGDKVTGVAVNIGARILARAGAGEILVSSTVKDLVSGSETAFEDRGSHELKGVTGNWHLFAVAREALELKPLPEKLATPAKPRRRRRALWAAVVAALVVATAVSVPLILAGDEGVQQPPPESGGFAQGVVRLDPNTNEVAALIKIRLLGFGFVANPIASGEGSVWLSPHTFSGGVTKKINPSTNTITARIEVPGLGVAIGYGAVWVAGAYEGVFRIDPRTNQVTEVPRSAPEPVQVGELASVLSGPLAVAVGEGSVWASWPDAGTILRIDPEDATVRDRIRGVRRPQALAVGETGEGIWVVDPVDGAAVQIDPDAGGVDKRVTVAGGATDVAIGEGSVWVTNGSGDTVTQIDPDTQSIIRTIPVGDGPSAIEVGEGSVWVANAGDGTLSRVDPVSHEVETIGIGGSPAGLAIDESGVWVAVYRNAYIG